MPRVINAQGLTLLKSFESLRLDAYQDVAGIWTIGYGHTGGVTPGMQITEAQADQDLLNDLAGTEAAVNSAIGDAATTDNQFSAMVVLCFNIGSANYRSSTVLRDHLAGDYPAAADAFLMWNEAHVNGVLQVVAGLTRRRTAERALYLS
ncbi:MAG TPA: lysozyme [Acetobacteraceae bacterium]|jgi:lysozyme